MQRIYLQTVKSLHFLLQNSVFLVVVFPSKAGDPSSIFDVHLTIEARRMKKFVSSLETVDIYCEVNRLISRLSHH